MDKCGGDHLKAFTQNLGKELSSQLKKADEIWVAVALMTNAGLNFIQDNLKKGAIEHYVLGINLPTDPKALILLNKQQYLQDLTVRMYLDKEYFHPKLYVIRQGKKYVAFIGSANCTNGGLNANVELSFINQNESDCMDLIKWFNELSTKSASLDDVFIIAYKVKYEDRKRSKKEEEKESNELKKELLKENQAEMVHRKKLLLTLKLFKRIYDHKNLIKEKRKDVTEIRASLDYPKFKNIDVEAFFENHALGHIISIPKPTIQKELDRFRKMLKVLTDESIDVAVRYDRALKGDLEIRGVKEATISKLLIVHNPNLYFVKNSKSNSVLKKHGFELPRGISKGEKYKATCNYLLGICEEVGIENLAVLDHYLYLEAES